MICIKSTLTQRWICYTENRFLRRPIFFLSGSGADYLWPETWVGMSRAAKKEEKYWNIDGSRDLYDSWTGFTQFTLLEEKPPNGYMLVREETDKAASDTQARPFTDRTPDEIGKKC